LTVGLCGCNGNEPATTPVATNKPVTDTQPATSTGTTETTPKDKPATAPSSGVDPSDPVIKHANEGLSGVPTSEKAVTPKPKPQDQPVAGQWVASNETSAAVAEAADRKVASLRNVLARISVFYEEPGGRGEQKDIQTFVDSTKFCFKYPLLRTGEKEDMLSVIFKSDGKTVALVVGPGVQMKKPIKDFKPDTKMPVDKWVLSFPQVLLTSVCGGRPLQDLVATAQQAKSGYSVKAEERTYDYQGKTYHQQRLTIEGKTPKGAPLQIIAIIDKDFRLPVTINATSGTSKDDKVLVRWKADWNFHPKLPFDAAQFVIPKS